MKIIKLTKKDYVNLEHLLKRVGLVREKLAFPNNIFVNASTYRRIKQEHTKLVKKITPNATKKRIDYSVGFELLNLGPSVLSNKEGGNNLPNGYAIVLPISDKDLK